MDEFCRNEISKIENEFAKLKIEISVEENLVVKKCTEILNNCSNCESVDDILRVFERLMAEFDKNFESRIFAARNKTYDVILKVLKRFDDHKKVVFLALKVMIRLLSCESNLLNAEGIEYQMNLLKREKSLSNVQLLLRWMKQCCLKNEKNKQDIFNARVTDDLKYILQSEFLPASKLRDVCSLLRALILDDDPRFDYGNGLKRAQDIAKDILIPITILLKKFQGDKIAINDILKTHIAFLVRNEYCKIIEEVGGLGFVLQAMRSFPDDENLNYLVMKLIKVLTGNDYVKVKIVAQGGGPLLVAAMSRLQTETVAVAGLSCIAALTFRSYKNSQIFYDLQVPSLIIETMKRYAENIDVQRQGARTISNMTSNDDINSSETSRSFIDLGVEERLEIAMKIHGDDMDNEIRQAFTDLGLVPELKYHWTKIPVKK